MLNDAPDLSVNAVRQVERVGVIGAQVRWGACSEWNRCRTLTLVAARLDLSREERAR